jgi:ABC-2 type transport system ATP-binding protein
VIRVRDFHKTYRETVAVAGLSFDVAPGEILGLVGPNGAGKTTTLRAIAGIIPPTRGQLLVAGSDVVREPVAAKRRMAYVPDDPKLFDTLTVWEHLEFIAAAYRVDGFHEKATELIAKLELDEKRNTIAQELSRGMRQKVAIACAYLHDPAVLLFDEPLTGLDPRGIRTMKDSILERARAGAAVIISSHLLTLVEDLSSHVLILHHGRRLLFGPIAKVREQFADLSPDATLEEVFFRATESGGAAGEHEHATLEEQQDAAAAAHEHTPAGLQQHAPAAGQEDATAEINEAEDTG